MAPFAVQIVEASSPTMFALSINPMMLAAVAPASIAVYKAHRLVTAVYEFCTPDLCAIINAVRDTIERIATKLKEAVRALVKIIKDTEPNPEGKRKTYCIMTLRVEDPYSLWERHDELLGSLRTYEADLDDAPEYYLPQRLLQMRKLRQRFENFKEECETLEKVTTRSSARILGDCNARAAVERAQAVGGAPGAIIAAQPNMPAGLVEIGGNGRSNDNILV